MSSGGSVTTWIGMLELGDRAAAQKLWERYFPRLISLARAKLRGTPRRAADEEDVALSAMHTFFQAAAQGKIPQLQDRDDLWRTLVLITAGKAIDQRRRDQSKKRGGSGSDAGHQPSAPGARLLALEEVVGTEPDPAFAALLADEFQALLARLSDDRLREIALLKLEGHTHEEISAKLACSVRTVNRRLILIHRTWESAVAG
jgi:DNA-directed RNA polymerase specialized sigma24 family protein